MDVNAIASAVKEIFGFLTVLNDPVKRKEMYQLKIDKKARLALNAGEQFILSFKTWEAADEKHKLHYRKKLAYWEKVFFQNN